MADEPGRPVSRVPPGIEATPGILALYERHGAGYPWWVTGVSVLGSFATLLTATIINVAIPDIMGALGLTIDQAQNLVSAHLAAGTVTMLMTAWAIRAFGIVATYLFNMMLFAVSCVAGGLAMSGEILFLARLVQGAASGIIMPLSMIMIAQVFPVDRRGMAMGWMAVGTVLAPALGPTLGGYLVDNLSWRWVFFMAIPFAVVSLPLALVFFPTREERGPRPSFDWVGVFLCAVFLLSLLTALTEAQSEGWYDDRVTVALGGTVVGFVAWIFWEARVDEPILDLRLFRNVRFLGAAIVTFTVGAALYGSTYIFPLFLQSISRLIPTESGLLMAPAGLVMAALFPLSGYLADRVSIRVLVTVGLVVTAWSCWLMRNVDAFTPVWDMVIWYAISRAGLALIFPGLNAAPVNALPLELIPNGAGMINFVRQLGGALGVNLLSFALIRQTAQHQGRAMETQTWDNSGMAELIRLVQEEFTYLGFIGYQGFEMSFGYVMAIVSSQGSMLGYRDAFLLVGVILLVSVLPVWMMGENRSVTRRRGI